VLAPPRDVVALSHECVAMFPQSRPQEVLDPQGSIVVQAVVQQINVGVHVFCARASPQTAVDCL
jgi:hypothetical protein